MKTKVFKIVRKRVSGSVRNQGAGQKEVWISLGRIMQMAGRMVGRKIRWNLNKNRLQLVTKRFRGRVGYVEADNEIREMVGKTTRGRC